MTYFRGTDGNDSFSGGNSSDVAYGQEGNDTLDAGSHLIWPLDGSDSDLLSGGEGDDVLLGLVAGDTADGGAGIDSAEVDMTCTYKDWVADTVLATANGTGINVNLSDAAGSGSLILTVGSGFYAKDILLASVETYDITFGAGNDTAWGGDNADRLIGERYNFHVSGLGFDELHGGGGDDYIDGMRAADILDGGSGNDILDGGTISPGFDDYAADSMFGGSGNDTFIYRTLDNVDGGTGTDTLELFRLTAMMIDLSITGPQFTGAGEGTIINIENIVGSSENDTLSGDDKDNEIDGYSGCDVILGRGGNDTLLSGNFMPGRVDGGDGNDIIYGHSQGDVLIGGQGIDFMRGYLGNDTYVADESDIIVEEYAGYGIDLVETYTNFTLPIHVDELLLKNTGRIGTGNASNNKLISELGHNTLIGGQGNDTYIVYNGFSDSDVIIEFSGEGTDSVHSYAATIILAPFVENLILIEGIGGVGNNGNNAISGNDSNNSLDGGAGADTLTGGLGNDTYIVERNDDNVVEANNEGTDSIFSSVTYALSGRYVEVLTLTGTDAINATGNSNANTLNGNSAANTLTGLGGHDVLDGGGGNDTLIGGSGNETYYVDATGDSITELAGEGTDYVFSTATFTLGAEVENLTLTGTAAINATGNTLSNILTGNDGNNVLTGGAGNDTYYVQNTGDNVVEANNNGTDVIVSTVNYSLSGRYVEYLSLTGAAAINATGNSNANTLTGNSAANTLTGLGGHDSLDGGADADTLVGGTGNDTYVIDNAGDTITELAGEGTDLVQSSITWTLGTDVENLTLTGSAAINATGTSGNNVLTGNTGNNVLTGLNGNDTYYVQNTGDNVVENSTGGTDAIFSTVTYNLNGRYIETLTLTGTANINATGNSLAQALNGNDGNNTLNGKGGTDVLTGGLGADIFLFEAASGTDTITDFNASQNDSINVNAYTAGVANNGMVVQAGANVTIFLSAGNVITVNNATQADVLAHVAW